MNIRIINNTGKDISQFDAVFAECVKENKPLPEELADIFTLTVSVGANPDGSNRGRIEWA